MMPNPNTATRQEFTQNLVSQQCPSNATTKYRQAFTKHQELLDLLGNHSAMVPNNQQTYSTPANSKNKVYFMYCLAKSCSWCWIPSALNRLLISSTILTSHRWDFVGRSLGMLMNVSPARPSGELWSDVQSRAMMAQMLIKDTTGKLDAMNASVGYNHDAGVTFGGEVERSIDGLVAAL